MKKNEIRQLCESRVMQMNFNILSTKTEILLVSLTELKTMTMKTDKNLQFLYPVGLWKIASSFQEQNVI